MYPCSLVASPNYQSVFAPLFAGAFIAQLDDMDDNPARLEQCNRYIRSLVTLHSLGDSLRSVRIVWVFLNACIHCCSTSRHCTSFCSCWPHVSVQRAPGCLENEILYLHACLNYSLFIYTHLRVSTCFIFVLVFHSKAWWRSSCSIKAQRVKSITEKSLVSVCVRHLACLRVVISRCRAKTCNNTRRILMPDLPHAEAVAWASLIPTLWWMPVVMTAWAERQMRFANWFQKKRASLVQVDNQQSEWCAKNSEWTLNELNLHILQ